MRASMLGSRCVCDPEVGATRSAETTKRTRKRLRVLFRLMLSLGKFQIRSLPSIFSYRLSASSLHWEGVCIFAEPGAVATGSLIHLPQASL